MNAYNLSLLLFSFSSFFVGLLVLLKRNDEIGKLCFAFNVFVAGWSFATSWMFSNDYGYAVSLWSTRAAHFCSIFITATWLHLVFTYIDLTQKKIQIIKFVYLMSFVLALTVFTPWFISHVKPIIDFQFYTGPGPIYYFYTVEFTVIILYGFHELIQAARSQIGDKKKQIYTFTIITAIGFISGSLSFLPVFDIPLPQYNIFVTPFYPFLLAYAVMKQGVMEPDEVLAIHKDKLALIGLISSSINHEIKNPLFLLKGYVQKMELSTKDPSLPKMSEQISRMSNLVERLGEFAKPGSGNKEEVYLEKAIDNALFFAMQELKYQNIEVKTNIEKPLPNPIGNRGQFEEIFLNLIINAFHAMSDGGTLTIEAKTTTSMKPLGFSRGDDASHKSVMVSIIDSGHGIPKDRLKHVFEPFYTTKQGRGTGLGLHIVKTLVEQNGGKISVESEMGRGTTFKLIFQARD